METDRGTLKVTIARAFEQPLVARLMQLYLHDFSTFAQLDPSHGDVDDDGLFPYPWLDFYWTEKKREPFLFRVDGRLAGFALIGGWSASGRGTDWGMAEFFVMRKYRRCGFGSEGTRQILGSHPGLWEIPVASYNQPAAMFWRKAIYSLDGYDVEELTGDGVRWSGPILRLTPRT
jgi:predicted acetyltransferase